MVLSCWRKLIIFISHCDLALMWLPSNLVCSPWAFFFFSPCVLTTRPQLLICSLSKIHCCMSTWRKYWLTGLYLIYLSLGSHLALWHNYKRPLWTLLCFLRWPIKLYNNRNIVMRLKTLCKCTCLPWLHKNVFWVHGFKWLDWVWGSHSKSADEIGYRVLEGTSIYLKIEICSREKLILGVKE